MRSLAAIFFLILFGVAANIQSSYYYFWKLNQQEIIREFCVNVDKPVLKCNGKCHLMKKLNVEQNTDDVQKNQPARSAELRIPVVEYIAETKKPTFQLETVLFPEPSTDHFPDPESGLCIGYLAECLHPPAIV